jgi:hypothetical protein
MIAPRFLAIREAAARSEHGTRARYVAAGCRCMLCRAANSRYSVERDRARREDGDRRELVDAGEARRHLRKLSRQGIGYKQVAESAKVSINVTAKILSGARKRIRANTARAVLAVTKANALLGDNSLVASGPTWRKLDELLGRGYSKAQLAKWLGHKAPALQIKRGGKITARTAFEVARMAEKIEAGLLRRER